MARKRRPAYKGELSERIRVLSPSKIDKITTEQVASAKARYDAAGKPFDVVQLTEIVRAAVENYLERELERCRVVKIPLLLERYGIAEDDPYCLTKLITGLAIDLGVPGFQTTTEPRTLRKRAGRPKTWTRLECEKVVAAIRAFEATKGGRSKADIAKLKDHCGYKGTDASFITRVYEAERRVRQAESPLLKLMDIDPEVAFTGPLPTRKRRRAKYENSMR